MTLLSPNVARERAQEKQHTVLHFLRDNKWTTQNNVQCLLGLRSRQAAHKTLIRLEAQQMIKRHQVRSLAGKPLTIWGITVHGIMYSYRDGEPMTDVRAFEPSKLSSTQMQHHLGLQQIQIRLIAAGWRDWHRETFKNKNNIVPDVIVTHPNGWPVAVEFERTLKSLRRYKEILLGHLTARKHGNYRDIYYITPDEPTKARLDHIFTSIKSVRCRGESIRISPELKAPFHFFSLASPFESTER
ncbi:MAG: MobC family replication-relaxation protein [Kordiimonas sp.]